MKTTAQYHNELDSILARLQYENQQEAWYYVISMLERGFVDENHFISTAAVMLNGMNFNLSLVYNKKAWDTLFFDENPIKNCKKKFGVTIHEFLHVIYDHIFIVKDFEDKKLFNIAADIVVNQEIPFEWIPYGIHLRLFPDFNLIAKQSVHYYYEELKKKKEKLDADKKGDKPLNESQKKLDELLLNDDNSHDFWTEIYGNLNEAEKIIFENNLKAQLEQAKNFGSVPNCVEEWLDLRKPVINRNWKKDFRNGTKGNVFELKNTWYRPNHRFPEERGHKMKQRPKYLIAIDTSGSMSKNSLDEFVAELDRIKRQSNAEIYIVECDCQIHKVIKYEKKNSIKSLEGRGGTDFNPVILYANKTLKPDMIIYYTDGYCTAPSEKSNTKILWVLSNEGTNIDAISHFPGKKIKIIL